MTRRVMVFKWNRPDNAKINDPYEKVQIGAGNFHQFGTDFEEVEYGVGSFSTAIVEMPDGQVINIPADLIRFDEDT